VTAHGRRGVPREVRTLAACVLVLFVSTLAAGVEAGRACSCALPDPRAALAQADGAFIGTLVSRRQLEQRAELTFSVERTLKGSIGQTVEVVTASNGAACGLEAPIGTRLGLVLERRAGAWHGHLCWQFAPAELLTAALPLPAPNGRGPIALVVGAGMGDTRLLALDRRGRTLAYGRGGGRAGLVAVCPGSERLAELAYVGSGTTLAVRTSRTLRIVRRQTVQLPGGRYALRLGCQDRSGSSVVVFARGPLGDSPAKAALYRLTERHLVVLWTGAAFDAGLTSSTAYLSAGMGGRTLLRVDLRSPRTTRLGTLPGPTTSLAANEGETLLAGVGDGSDRPSQIVRVDLGRKPAKVTTARLTGREVYGQVFWLPNGRLLFVPAYGGTAAHVYDRSLRTRSRFRWTAGQAALVGSSVFGTDQSFSLLRADLPAGPQHVARRLPGRPTLIVSATG
jgi:hypothetical protein